MEECVFKKSRSLEDILKSLYSHLCRDIAPAVFGMLLFYIAYFEYFEDNEPYLAVCYLVVGIVSILYALYRYWKLYKDFSMPRIKSIVLDEKGLRIDFNKYPYKVEASWKDIEQVEYFPGEVEQQYNSTIEYLDYTDIYGRFKDYRGADFNNIIRIMNSSEWGNEQGETLFSVLLKFEGSKDKLKIVGRD